MRHLFRLCFVFFPPRISIFSNCYTGIYIRIRSFLISGHNFILFEINIWTPTLLHCTFLPKCDTFDVRGTNSKTPDESFQECELLFVTIAEVIAIYLRIYSTPTTPSSHRKKTNNQKSKNRVNLIKKEDQILSKV